MILPEPDLNSQKFSNKQVFKTAAFGLSQPSEVTVAIYQEDDFHW